MNHRHKSSFWTFDHGLVVTCLIVLSTASYLLVYDQWLLSLFDSEVSHLDSIGTVTQARNDVRRRYPTSFSWLPLGREEEIYQGDTIFTGDNSKVKITTTAGDEIELAENSLIVIKRRKDAIQLEINFGSLQGKVDPSRKIRLSSSEGVTEISGGGRSVVGVSLKNKKALSISAVEGQIEVLSPDGMRKKFSTGTLQLNSTEETEDPSNVEIKMTEAPKLIEIEQKSPPLLRWQSSKPVKRYEIEFFEQQNQKKTLRKIVSDQPLLEVPKDFAQQKIALRVKAIGQNGQTLGMSKMQGLTFVRSSVAKLVSPQNQQQIDPEKGDTPETSIQFQWDSDPLLESWLIEVIDQKSTKTAISEIVSRKQSASFSMVPGFYRWRLKNLDIENASWSDFSDFEILPKNSLKSFIPRWANTEINHLLKQKPRGGIDYPILKIKARPDTDMFEIEVSEDPLFSKVSKKFTTRRRQVQWRSALPGQYFLRVRAVKNNKKTAFGLPLTAVISIPSPTSLTKAVQTETVPDLALLDMVPPPITLKWSPHPLASRYLIQIGRRSNLADAQELTVTNQTEIKFNIPEMGDYFWRIRSIDLAGKTLSQFSPIYKTSFQRVYENPDQISQLKLLYPKSNTTVVFVGNGKDQLRFRWTKPFEKVTYRIQMSQDFDFERLSYESTLSSNIFSLKEVMLPPGWIFWRVRAETKQFQSPWTTAFRFQLSYEQNPFELKESPKELSLKRNLASARKIIAPDSSALSPPALGKQAAELPKPALLGEELILLEEKSGARKPLLFDWAAPETFNEFRIQVARDREFKDKIINEKVNGRFWQWTNPQVGRFFWRASLIDSGSQQESQYSLPKNISVTISAPQITSTDSFIRIVPDSRFVRNEAPQVVEMAWQPQSLAAQYLVRLAENTKFENAKSYLVSKPPLKIKISRPGVYYWQVVSLDSQKQSVSEFSEVRPLIVDEIVRKPSSTELIANLFPDPDRSIVIVGQGQYRGSFSWSSQFTDGHYHLQVSKSPSFEQLVISQKTRSLQAPIDEDLPAGELYWRVEHRSESGKITQSSASRFTVRRESVNYPKENERAPANSNANPD